MADININQLNVVTTVPESSTYIPLANKDTNSGNVITVGNLKNQIVDPGSGVGIHNRYRGKNLGTTFTSTQSTNIKNGSFEDLYVGDYWTIENVVYRIAGCDLAYNCGDTNLTTHHVVVVPDVLMYTCAMNEIDSTEGGYVGSTGRTEGLVQATDIFIGAFGDAHVLSYRDYLSNAVTNGKSSAAAWNDCRVEFMNELFTYGSLVRGLTQFDVGIFCFQAPLFKQASNLIHTHQAYWLRSVATDIAFSSVHSYGRVTCTNASSACGVRPFALIS